MTRIPVREGDRRSSPGLCSEVAACRRRAPGPHRLSSVTGPLTPPGRSSASGSGMVGCLPSASTRSGRGTQSTWVSGHESSDNGGPSTADTLRDAMAQLRRNDGLRCLRCRAALGEVRIALSGDEGLPHSAVGLQPDRLERRLPEVALVGRVEPPGAPGLAVVEQQHRVGPVPTSAGGEPPRLPRQRQRHGVTNSLSQPDQRAWPEGETGSNTTASVATVPP